MAEIAALCRVEDIAVGTMPQEFLPDGPLIALYNVEGHIFECGWHNGSFDVTTGEPCASPCAVALKTFPVKVVDRLINIEY